MNRTIKINTENAAKLKDFRIKHRVKSKDLALFIGKSPAYISKLEHGDIQHLSKDVLIKITNYISGDENGYTEFCQSVIESKDPDTSEKDIFLLNFDTTERQIPIPEILSYYIQEQMHNLNITSNQLIDYVNENEDIKDDYSRFKISIKDIETNTWYEYIEADSNERFHIFIVLHFEKEKLDALLNHELKKCEYLFPYALTYHLLKISKGYRGKLLTESEIRSTQAEAEEILWKMKFYTMMLQMRKLQDYQSIEEFENSLSSFDHNNRQLLQELIGALSYLSSYDIEYTNKKLNTIVENIKDVGESFSLAFMALSLKHLKELNPHMKKQFLSDIEKYINTYTAADNVTPYEKY